MDKEVRNYSLSEVRACGKEEDKRTVVGYAAVFDSESQDLGGFVEVIDRGAFDDVIAGSDVFALLNHSNERGILARSKYGEGTLSLSIDDKGLRYEFEAPNTALGDEVLEYLRRGDISQSSFAFTVREDTWTKRANGYLRTINKVEKLYDVSPVFTPAYEATEVKCARFAEVQEEERLANEKAMKEAKEKRAAEVADYYTQLRSENEKYLMADK